MELCPYEHAKTKGSTPNSFPKQPRYARCRRANKHPQTVRDPAYPIIISSIPQYRGPHYSCRLTLAPHGARRDGARAPDVCGVS
ncbi:hypothetical protein EVAR_59681_1 [Eumeta japonica]|uniref:Uncharacterized protein n=1 Tax=Eumeta variegata TaxID=151549 RepID=A0A4C1Z356_EUMVA|nr:hypothetical protein EVAR_59681_1 [Eumeta japonica]